MASLALEENTVMSSGREAFAQKAERAYTFLAEAASTHCLFTLEEFATCSGYTVGTARIYFSKKWYWFSEKQRDGRYQIKNQFLGYSLDEFKEALRQKASPPFTELQATSDWKVIFCFSTPTTLALVSFLLAWALTLHTLRKHFW